MLTKEDAVKVMKNVKDPELGVDIYTLGLIYDTKIKDNDGIYIRMTFTSPACPFGPEMISDLKIQLTKAGFADPEIELTFDPLWEPSEELRAMLGV